MANRLASALLTILCLASLATGLCAQTTGSVTKTVQGNPTLGITSFSGDASARGILETMLVRCDWFQVVKDSSADRAQARLDVTASGNAYLVQARISGAQERIVRVNASGSDWHDAAAKAVDSLLAELFGVPALCTRPIAYVMTDAGGKKEVFTIRVDGSGQKRLTHNNALSTEPAWGHSGALVYTLNQNNALKIVLVDLKNNRQRTISSSRGLNASAALSRDGRYVALPLSLGKQVDLYLLDLKEGRRTRLTQDRDVESSPAFSPDGAQICFVSDRTGRPQLYLISTSGGDARRLTKGASECVSPDWSPKSNKLCYSTRVNGQYVVAVMDPSNPQGGHEIVTDAAGNWEAPSWAPDGRHIVCTRSTGGKQDLYMVDTLFHTFQPLTRGARLSLPAWAPAK
mgnify:FL=1